MVAAATGRDDPTVRARAPPAAPDSPRSHCSDAELRPGIDLILELLGFDRAVAGADLVITGEGSLDEQSLAGKAPVGVAAAAGAGRGARRRRRRPVPARARSDCAGPASPAAYPLTDLEPDLARSMADAAALLRQVGRRIAKEWLT